MPRTIKRTKTLPPVDILDLLNDYERRGGTISPNIDKWWERESTEMYKRGVVNVTKPARSTQSETITQICSEMDRAVGEIIGYGVNQDLVREWERKLRISSRN